ncbi:MAG: hypothetical protein ACJAYU_002569 [Bradymonadia bacterium]
MPVVGSCEPDGLGIVEVFFNPVGEDREADFEFIEISGTIGQSLEGITLAVVDADARRVHEVSLSGSIGANGLALIGGSGMEPDIELGVSVDNGAGAIQLVDCGGRVVDAIAWGTFDNDSAFPGEGEPAAIPPEGNSLARCTGAESTEDNRSDFGLADPSAGEANAAELFADPTFCSGETGGCDVASLADLRIEEVLYNPEGTDSGAEFIELSGPPGLALDGVRVTGVNGGSGFELFSPIVLAGAIGDSGVFVVGGAAVPGLDYPLGEITIQNGPDTIRVLACDGRTILDAMAYGNFDGDDEFAGEGSAAAPAPEGFSLSRCADADDTNDNSADFGPAPPTPGAKTAPDDFANPNFCGGSSCIVGEISAVFSEVLYDPDGADADLEFIELRGTPGASLAGGQIAGINGGTGEEYGETLFLDGTFGDDGLFLLGGQSVPDADQELTVSIQNGPDSLVLFDCDGETPLDALAYGAFGEDEFASGEGAPAPPATGGLTLSRCESRDDTGDNVTDFGVANATPGSPNTSFVDPLFCEFDPTACIDGAAVGIRINEVNANPAGSDGDSPTEFVELNGTSGANVTGLWLSFVNGSNGETYAAPTRLVGELNADGFFVLGQDGVTPDQLIVHSMQNGPDSVQLLDCDGITVLDAVGYGSFSEENFFAGEGRAAPSSDGRSLSRCQDVPDSGDNQDDFSSAEPTPGRINSGHDDALFCDATECVPTAPGSVLLNEIMYDPVGSDGDGENEFIELIGAAEAVVTGLRLYGVNGSNGDQYLGPIVIVGSLDSSGFLVLGGSAIPEASLRLPSTMQNGPDSIELRGCDDALIDAVAYGEFSETEFPAGEGDPAPDVTDTSIGRSAGDTDDNATDFAAQTAPSPGAANE